MKIASVVSVFVLALWATSADAQYCRPDPRPANPAPAGESCRVQIVDNFNLNQEASRTVAVESGKSYWFAASGCPRMGRIRIAVLDGAGKTLKSDEGYSPSLCITAKNGGKYTIRVKAVSLTGSYTWGTIDACFSASNCRE